jgi:hypothetical protein
MSDPIQYAETAETLADFFPNVDPDNTGQVATLTRLLQTASSMIDRFTKRPPGYFVAIGPTSGSRQKINVLIDADGLLMNSTVRFTVTAARLLDGTPIETDIAAVFPTDDSASIATAFAAALAADTDINDFFNIAVGDDGISIDLQFKELGTLDPTFAATVAGVGAGTGVVSTTGRVVAGSYSPAAVRRYRGWGSNYLRIGQHVRGSVTISGFAAADFYEADNGWIYASDVPATSPGQTDDRYCRPIRLFTKDSVYLVSARWGFENTPPDIVTACKMIAQHVWDRGQGTFGQVTPTGFVIDRDIPPPVRLMLDLWVRKEFELN